MTETIESPRGVLTRTAARVRPRGAEGGQPRVDVVALIDATGAKLLAVVRAAAVFDGVPRKPGQFLPAAFRTSCLRSAVRMRQVAAIEPPAEFDVEWLDDDEAAALHQAARAADDQQRGKAKGAAVSAETLELPEPPPEPKPKPAPPAEPANADPPPADGRPEDADQAAAAEGAQATYADEDTPGWYGEDLNDHLSQRIMRQLKKANIRTAGELETYANTHGGDLAGLGLTDGQTDALIDAMAKLTKSGDD